LKSVDSLFGPITTVRRNGRIQKKIPWSAFQLHDEDWERIRDVRDILKVCGLLVPVLDDRLMFTDRIPTVSNTTSLQNGFPLSGEHFLR
jgi:hypothetical protein